MRLSVHKEACHDVAWGAAHVFASCAADGSARVVDTRCGALRSSSCPATGLTSA